MNMNLPCCYDCLCWNIYNSLCGTCRLFCQFTYFWIELMKWFTDNGSEVAFYFPWSCFRQFFVLARAFFWKMQWAWHPNFFLYLYFFVICTSLPDFACDSKWTYWVWGMESGAKFIHCLISILMINVLELFNGGIFIIAFANERLN